ncbi:MAG: DUF2946 family protein [Thiomonas sp.]|uniref:DUF2946 family protein n=1 Tax=Thiomonas sp. TaxID=2047785 RepID=UPI002A360B56|nr:DUF2946 family protein [Thiomonas sp.]MDY0331111.1 DUF2946 family protein [Thiomonas sp.]
MDAAVLQSLAHWPHVPRCTGWLALDQRGQWWMRHQAGPAIWPRDAHGRLVKTDAGPVLHAGLTAFIGRNYTVDATGAWYFQNGPQRVDVSLEVAPWIIRLQSQASQAWSTHTGQTCKVESIWLDGMGRIWLRTHLGPGLLHSADMPLLADRLDAQGTQLRLPGSAPMNLGHFTAPPATFFGFRLDPP